MWFQWSQYVTKSRILNITLFPVIQIKLASGVPDNPDNRVLGAWKFSDWVLQIYILAVQEIWNTFYYDV